MTKGKLYELQAKDVNIPKDCGWSNGKLYRNLSDLLYWKEGADEGNSVQYDTRDILDEAKKEFPFWYMYDGRTYKQYKLTDEQFKESAIIGLDSIATNQWFKKWFGDES
jgi:hypothetical protein